MRDLSLLSRVVGCYMNMRALHERALHGVVVLEAQWLPAVELLPVERELYARLARLLEVAGGQHEAHLVRDRGRARGRARARARGGQHGSHLALGDEGGRHALLHPTHAHADADLAWLGLGLELGLGLWS